MPDFADDLDATAVTGSTSRQQEREEAIDTSR